jgi:hypothetical protein
MNMIRITTIGVLLALGSLASSRYAAAAPPAVVLLPQSFTLDGEHAEQRLIVEEFDGTEYCGNWPGEVALASTNSDVVAVVGKTARPVANGRAAIVGQVNGEEVRAEVEVTRLGAVVERSFRNDVLPVFAKAGCNMGACHGALAGKGGFKLSLRGYDPDADYVRIAHEAAGRRIESLDPGRSLLLAKPSGAIPHKGGLRFDVGSEEYQIIADWIAQGAPPPEPADPVVKRLEIIPERTLLAPGDRQQLILLAHYSDGRRRDVTRWAKFDATQVSVAKADDQGVVEVVGSGEGAVTAWYDSKIAIARVTVPFAGEIDESAFAVEEKSASFIDQLVLKQLRRLHLTPSPQTDDATFIRRAYVDTIGALPTAEEVHKFIADDSPDKRNVLIDDLFSREEFVDYWAYKWSDLLLVNGQLLRPDAVKAYYLWIREQVEKNTPWDEFAMQLMTAQGNTIENGATNFYAIHQDPEALTENACQAFLGLSIGCAKCHNHPLEKWTNDQYYAMANMFARVRGKGWGGDPRSGDGAKTVYVSSSGDLLQPSKAKPQPPTPLDGRPLPIDWPGDRRVPLAEWLTDADNPYFARAIANRVWANYLGVGLVEEVDDMRESNPASNEQLMDALAEYLVQHDFDLRALMKEILRSRTYQRSSRSLPSNRDEKRFYARYYPQRMQSEVLLDAISQVTDVPTEFSEIAYPSSDKFKTDIYPKGTRALQLYDSAVMSHFLSSFGRNSRTITCECERSDDPSIVQVLHISNGDTINSKLSNEHSRIDALMRSGLTNRQLVEQAYLIALARRPTADEMDQLTSLLTSASPDNKREVVEDLFWGILSSREFLFNH